LILEEDKQPSKSAGEPKVKENSKQIYKAVVQRDRCTACGICQMLCPVGAITMQDVAIINEAQCSGCGVCVRKCPQLAIYFNIIPMHTMKK